MVGTEGRREGAGKVRAEKPLQIVPASLAPLQVLGLAWVAGGNVAVLARSSLCARRCRRRRGRHGRAIAGASASFTLSAAGCFAFGFLALKSPISHQVPQAKPKQVTPASRRACRESRNVVPVFMKSSTTGTHEVGTGTT